jgi:hypothetical protein
MRFVVEKVPLRQVLQFSPVSAMPPTLHTRLHFNTICIRMTEEWSLGAFKPSSAVRISGSAKQESIFKLLVPKQEFGVRQKELLQRA